MVSIKHIGFTGIGLLFTLWVCAQEVKFEATVSKESVALNETFKVTFTVNASATNFRPPGLSENFRVVQGPMTSSQMSYVNGKISSSLSYSYYLQPIETGTFIIEPASVEANGERYSSNPVKVTVTKAVSPKNAQQSSPSKSAQQKSSSPTRLFINETVNKRSVYRGEQLVLSYDIFSRVDINSYEFGEVPDFRGFYTKEIEVNPVSERTRAEVNGKSYTVFPIKKTILFPTIAGDLSIDPMTMDFVVRVREDKPVNTFFGPRYRYREEKRSVKSNTLKINVKPLPAGEPPSFNGAVGNFQFTGELDQTEIKTNEAINLKMRLSGTGNINLADIELPDFPSDFEVYDPEVNTSSNTAGNRLSGAKTWNILMIPRTGGTFTIPEIAFSFFDPDKEKYVERTIGPFTIRVAGGSGEASGPGTRYRNKKEIQQVGSDIRYIKTGDPELQELNASWLNQPAFYFLLFLPFGLLALTLLTLRQMDLRARDVKGNKRKRASKMAKKLLAEAKKAQDAGNEKAFYESIFNALYGYLADKLNLPASELNKERIRSLLSEKSIPEHQIERLIVTLNTCEMGRFAPVELSTEELYNNSEQVILELEEQLKA